MNKFSKGMQALSADVTPANGAIVMGTGIVSIGLSLNKILWLSYILLAVGLIAWVLLAFVASKRYIVDRKRALTEMRSPASLTAVAGTSVLGHTLTTIHLLWLAVIFLLLAVILWLRMLPPVLRHMQRPTTGVTLVLTVSTESIGVLSLSIAEAFRLPWLVVVAVFPFILGLGLYVYVIRVFDLKQLLVGMGDHWITGGALAISTLVAGKITFISQELSMAPTFVSVMTIVATVLWFLTMAWLPFIVITELMKPRLTYDPRRWSTVFPVGMYAVCSFSVGNDVHNIPVILGFAEVWIWMGVLVWIVGMFAMLRHDWQVFKGGWLKG